MQFAVISRIILAASIIAATAAVLIIIRLYPLKIRINLTFRNILYHIPLSDLDFKVFAAFCSVISAEVLFISAR